MKRNGLLFSREKSIIPSQEGMNTLKTPGAPATSRARQAHQPSNPFAKALLEAGGSASVDPALSGLELGADMLNALMTGDSESTPSNQGSTRLQDIWNANEGVSPAQSFEEDENEPESFLDRELRMRNSESVEHLRTVREYDRREAERQRMAEELIAQLRTLSTQAGEAALKSQVTAVQGISGKAGEYHITFLEKMVRAAAVLKHQAGESNSWIAQSNQRRSDKLGYWDMFHKHGSQWFQSGERSITTSVG